MNEGTLGVHKIELVVDAGEDLSDGGGVGDHAAGAHDLGQVTTGDNGGGLVVDTALETGGGPVDKLDGALGLDGSDGGVDVLGDNVTTVHHAAGHVLAVAGIALNHHASGLEDGVGDLRNGELLVVGLLGADDRPGPGDRRNDDRAHGDRQHADPRPGPLHRVARGAPRPARRAAARLARLGESRAGAHAGGS